MTSPTASEPVTSTVLAAEDIRWSLVEPAPASTVTAAVVAAAKSIICRAIAACSVRLWVRLSAVVRRIWPGFRNA